MMCRRVFDFINGTEFVPEAPNDVAAARPRFDILHPGAEDEALVARHVDRLASLSRSPARAKKRCGH